MTRGRRRVHVHPERPAPRLTSWQMAVLRASRELSGDAKVLLDVMWELDRGSGAFMNPLGLAQQTGAHPDAVKRLRTELVRQGVLLNVDVPGSRLDFWFLLPPRDVDPEPPHDLTTEQKRLWVRESADAFDRSLRGASRPLNADHSGDKLSPDRGQVAASAPPLRGQVVGAQGASRPLTEHENAASDAPSVTLKAVKTQSVLLRESDTNRTRLKGVKPHDDEALDPLTSALVEKHARRRAQLAADENTATNDDELLL